MSKAIKITGGKELMQALETLPAKLQKSVMRKAMRQGAKVIAQEARRNVAPSLRSTVKYSTDTKYRQVVGKIQTKGKRAFITRFVEFGTAAHIIEPKNKKLLVFTARDGNLVRTLKVNHTGHNAKPFMRPAADTKSREALNAIVDTIRANLTVQGLNAPYVEVEE